MTSILDEMAKLEDAGCAPWQMSLRKFMLPRGGEVEARDEYASTADKLDDQLEALSGTDTASWTSVSNPEFTLFESEKQEVFCKIPHLYVEDSDGKVVAAHIGGDVYVAPEHRGKGLGAELFLARAVLHDNGVREGNLYSPGGLKAARRAHRMAVKWAFEIGKPVPAAVVEDYADISTTNLKI